VLSVRADGVFVFPRRLAAGASYAVEVVVQPSAP
jgi:hypothetical protein